MFQYVKVALLILRFFFIFWLPGLEFIILTGTIYKKDKYHFCSMLKTNQFSFIGKYKVWIHLDLRNLTESGGTILDLDARFNVNM